MFWVNGKAIERRIARLGEVEGQQIRNTNLTSNRLVSEPSEPASASAVKSSKSVGVKLRTPFVSKTEEYNIWKRYFHTSDVSIVKQTTVD